MCWFSRRLVDAAVSACAGPLDRAVWGWRRAGPVGRALARRLSVRWGQPASVRSPRAGAGAAPALVAKAPADGYTLLINTSAHAYSAAAASRPPV